MAAAGRGNCGVAVDDRGAATGDIGGVSGKAAEEAARLVVDCCGVVGTDTERDGRVRPALPGN